MAAVAGNETTVDGIMAMAIATTGVVEVINHYWGQILDCTEVPLVREVE